MLIDDLLSLTIFNRKIFMSESVLNSHLPDNDTKKRFLEIANMVTSHTNFNDISKMEYILKLDFSLVFDTNNQSKIRNFLSDGDSNTHKCNPTNSSSENNFFNWNFATTDTIGNSMCSNVLDELQMKISDLMNVSPLSHGKSKDDYKEVMQNVCKTIFETHYTRLQYSFPSELDSWNNISTSSYVDQLYGNISRDVSKQYSVFTKNCDNNSNNPQSYFEAVYNYVMNYDKRGMKVGFKKLFIMTHYPYFLYEFLLNNIASQELDSVEAAPRLYFVQRIAVLSVYIFLFYVLLTIVINTNDGNNFQKGISIMADLNDELFKRESIDESTFGYHDLQNTTDKTHNLSTMLYTKQYEIEMMKNNLQKAAVAEVSLKSPIKKSRLSYISWIIFMIIVVIVLSTLLFLPFMQNKMQYFWGFAGFVIIVVIISSLVNIFSTKNI